MHSSHYCIFIDEVDDLCRANPADPSGRSGWRVGVALQLGLDQHIHNNINTQRYLVTSELWLLDRWRYSGLGAPERGSTGGLSTYHITMWSWISTLLYKLKDGSRASGRAQPTYRLWLKLNICNKSEPITINLSWKPKCDNKPLWLVWSHLDTAPA